MKLGTCDVLQVPVRVENDATAAAIAEQTTGSATELQSFCFVYFGTGLGLGVISNGEILRGAFGNAGELGHVVVERGGRLCSCGNRGCLETYTSRMAASEFLQKRGKSAESQKDLSDLLAANDPDLEEWISEAADPLAQAIGTLLVSLLLGTAVLSLVGCIGASLTVGLKRGGMLIALLILPLYIPVLIFGSAAVQAAVNGMPAGPHLAILGAMVSLGVALAPLAIAAGLRISIDA